MSFDGAPQIPLSELTEEKIDQFISYLPIVESMRRDTDYLFNILSMSHRVVLNSGAFEHYIECGSLLQSSLYSPYASYAYAADAEDEKRKAIRLCAARVGEWKHERDRQVNLFCDAIQKWAVDRSEVECGDVILHAVRIAKNAPRYNWPTYVPEKIFHRQFWKNLAFPYLYAPTPEPPKVQP